MPLKYLGHRAEGNCGISSAFQCTCNLTPSSSKLAFKEISSGALQIRG